MRKIIRDRFKKSENELVEERVGRLFLSLPNDCLTRSQREQLASLLFERIQAIGDSADVSPSQWKLVLAVLTKLMKRPTFCEVSRTYRPLVFHLASLSNNLQDMGFSTLVTIAEKASRCFATDSGARGWDEMRGLAPLYYGLAAAIMLFVQPPRLSLTPKLT